MSNDEALKQKIVELEELLEQSERKGDILTNLLREATVEFQHVLEQISTSEANFRSIIENAPEAIYIFDSLTHEILECNPYTLKWLGYSKEELLRKKVEDILLWKSSKERPSLPETRGLRSSFSEGEFIKKTGERVIAEITGTSIFYEDRKCFVAFVRDITERRKLEELSRYKELFDNMIDPVIICDPAGKILEVNDVFCHRFEYSREVLLQLSFRDLIYLDHLEILEKVLEALDSRESIHFEVDIRTRSGLLIPFEFHCRMISYLSKPAVLSVGRDLSARKRMEEIIVRNERLRAIGELSLGVAHNFNNLLQIIMSSAETIIKHLSPGDSKTTEEALGNILEACNRGVAIVNRVKDFTGKGEPKQEKIFDINRLISEAIKLAKPLWIRPDGSSNYHVLFSKSPPQQFVRGNPSEIYEVVINLIKNALEAMPNGGKLLITSETDGGVVRLHFHDTGHGIAPDHIQKIFEPFFTTKGPKSSGLGLSSSYGIIKKHGGQIRVQSYPGRGTIFSISLPLIDKDNWISVDSSDKQVTYVGDYNVPLRVLMVDDEIQILKMVKMWSEDTQVQFDTACSAEEALEAVSRTEYNIIICDYGMEEMNGLQLCGTITNHLKEMGKQKPSILLCTGLTTNFVSLELEQAGIDRILKKPISIHELFSVIHEITS